MSPPLMGEDWTAPAMGGSDRGLALAALAPVGVLTVIYALLGPDAPARAVVGQVALTIAPAVALVALLGAAWSAPRERRMPWLFFSAAAAAGLAGQLVAITQYVGLAAPPEFPGPALLLYIAFHPLFIAGTLFAMRGSVRTGLNRDTVLDAAVILAVSAVLLLRFAVEPALATTTFEGWHLVVLLLVPVLALASFCAAAALLLWRGLSAPDRVLGMLAGTGLALAIGNLLVFSWPWFRGIPGESLDLFWLAGWTCFALAGFAGASSGSWIVAVSRPGLFAETLRKAVIPGGTVFLGAIALHAALRPAMTATAGAIAVLGMVIAVRTTLALRAAERRAVERQEMAQTRALVELSRELAAVRNVKGTLELVAEAARRLLPAKAAVIELVDDDGDSLELRATAGLPEALVGLRYAIAGSFTGWVVQHGRPRATADATRDSMIQPQSLPFLGATAVAAAPLRSRDRTVGAIGVIRDEPFDPDSIRLLQLLSYRAAISIENAQLFEQVETLSLTDPLTKLANRRQLERELAREFSAATRGRRLVVAVFDLDGLKVYNDVHGHLAGDEALRLFGEILGGQTRAMNLAARYGGDEFVTLLTETDLEGAIIFVDRICERFRIESEKLGRGPLSISAGVAEYTPDMKQPQDLLAAADAALYRKKAQRARA